MPNEFSRSFRISAATLASVLALTAVAPVGVPNLISAAQAQVAGQPQDQIDFDAALEGYGHWVQHPRFGEVWVPDNVSQDWQPYRIGRWVYTDEWGWYWDSGEDFGWVTYHYGRWYFDREIGWVWIPSDEWGPAWVNWRQGDDFVGWAPTPPDEFLDDEEDPDTYMFVPAGELLAPDIYTVFYPYNFRRDYYRRSSLVNRTIYFRDRRGAVNPGIPPSFIAHASGRPFHSSRIAPAILAGTAGVAGAIILRNGFRDRSRTRVQVRQSDRVIQPSSQFQRLPGLNKGERGRLNNNAPLGARGGKAVLDVNTQVKTQGQRKFTPQATPQIQQQKIETQKFERRDTQQRDFQQKTIPNIQGNPGDNNRARQFEERRNLERRNNEQRNFEQRSIEQRNIQQQNQQQNRIQQERQQQNFRRDNNPPRQFQQNQQQQHQQQQGGGQRQQQQQRRDGKDKQNN